MKAPKIIIAAISACFSIAYIRIWLLFSYERSEAPALVFIFGVITIFFLFWAFWKKPLTNTSIYERVSPYLPYVPEATLANMRSSYTPQMIANDIKIMKEGFQILQSTTDMDAFLNALNLSILKAITLLQATQAKCIGIADPKFLVYQCEEVLANISTLKIEFLTRSFQKGTSDAFQLTAPPMQYQALEHYSASMESYREDFAEVSENFNKVINDVQSLMQNMLSNFLNPVEPSDEEEPSSSDNTLQSNEFINTLQLTYSDKSIDFYVPYRCIPPEIFELLWFSNGPFKNYHPAPNDRTINFAGRVIRINASGFEEPSAIDINLPFSMPNSPESLDYYPSYSKLTSSQRTLYLSWLLDITAPIDIGYVFIFYYGLERHLFFGKSEKAFDAILTLREYHHNKSFLFYSENALVLYALIKSSSDTLNKFDTQQLSPDLRLFIEALCSHSLSSQVIMDSHKHFLFDNTRYIKNEPDLFLSTLEELLNSQYGQPSLPISLDDFRNAQGVVSLVLANYSLLPQQRQLNLPDISTSPVIRSTAHTLLISAHETVKVKLREARKAFQSSK